MNAQSRIIARQAREAAERIHSIVRETPLERSDELSARTGGNVYVKLENLQHTGSFKLRGASNRLLTLTQEQQARGCVAASSGNHGAAAACAMRRLNISGVIFVPEGTSARKVEAIRSYGGHVRHHGTDGLDTEQHARQYADEHGMFYLSPYNDAAVITGQATCGLEIVEQLPDVDTVFIAVGGGGLAGGVGSVLRSHNGACRIVGCQPSASAVMAKSVAAGRLLDLPSAPTLSDGTAGGIEPGAITFDLCAELVDEFVLVGETEIAQAMRLFIDTHAQEIEGAAGVAVAGVLARADLMRGRNVVVIICGGNVTRDTLESLREQA